MITAQDFIAEAGRAGFDFYTGVPCSFLTPLINGVLSAPGLAYVGATSEGEAVAIAAGAWLAGRQTVVMCQNSGLGNAVNPLTSLNAPFRIPTLFLTDRPAMAASLSTSSQKRSRNRTKGSVPKGKTAATASTAR